MKTFLAFLFAFPFSLFAVSNSIPTDAFNRPPMEIIVPAQTSVFGQQDAAGNVVIRKVTYKAHPLLIAEPHKAKPVSVADMSAAIASKLSSPQPGSKAAIANVVQPPASNRVDIAAIKSYWHQAHITDGTNAAAQKTNYVYRLWMKTNITAIKTKVMDIPANGSDDTYYIYLTNTPNAFFFTQNVNLLLP